MLSTEYIKYKVNLHHQPQIRVLRIKFQIVISITQGHGGHFKVQFPSETWSFHQNCRSFSALTHSLLNGQLPVGDNSQPNVGKTVKNMSEHVSSLLPGF